MSAVTEFVEFSITIEDYRTDRQAVYDDWRDDPRWDALTAFMDALFPDCYVDVSGKLHRYDDDGELVKTDTP